MRRANSKLMLDMLFRRSPHRLQTSLAQSELIFMRNREKHNAGV